MEDGVKATSKKSSAQTKKAGQKRLYERIEAVDVGVALQDLYPERGCKDGEVTRGERFPDRLDGGSCPKGVSKRGRGDDQDPLATLGNRVRGGGAKG
jgi:hypothetical protein